MFTNTDARLYRFVRLYLLPYLNNLLQHIEKSRIYTIFANYLAHPKEGHS